MVSSAVIRRRLKKLREHLRYLTEYQKFGREEFLNTHSVHSTVERDFQLAIECAQDIGNHLIAEMRFREPESYADIFIILGENGVLQADFAQRFARISGFRNILVHEYLELDREIVYEHLQSKLDDFEVYYNAIIKYMVEDPA